MKRIKKVSQTTPTTAQVVNSQSNSQTDTYSCNYANSHSLSGSLTLLLDVSALATGSEYTLSEAITNYKYVMILISTADNTENGHREYIPVSQIDGYYNDTKYRMAMSLFQATNVFWFTDFYFLLN